MIKNIPEEEIVFANFDSLKAYKIGKEITEIILNKNLPVIIDIFAYGRILYHFSNDKTTPDKENWIRRKRNVVLYFGKSSKFMNEKILNNQMILHDKYGLNTSDYAAVAGSFPIKIKSCGTIGAISASGLTPDQDHNLIIDSIIKYLD